MGEQIDGLMQSQFPPRAVAPLVGLLTHDDAPCNGEMFSVGGGGFARIFAGVTPGYRSTDRDWTIEDAQANFATAMTTDGFVVPQDSMEEAALYSSDVPWSVFRQFIA